jgi:hypothetical protein
MTQEQVVETFQGFPKPVKSIVLRKLMKVFEEDLVEDTIDQAEAEGRELTVDERLAIVESLAGSIKMKNPPMTKEEEREMYYGYLAEKYK